MSDDTRNPGERPKTRFEPVPRREPQPPRPAEAGQRTEQGPPPQPPPPAPAPAPQPTPQPAAPSLTLRALEPGEAPRAAGLSRDERGFVVGARGIVAVQGARRLTAFLAALSQAADLSSGVALEAHADGLFLVSLTPPDTGGPPSELYDAVQGALAAARLSAGRARLLVGGPSIFVPYAGPDAPHGYDAQGAPPRGGRALLRPGAAPLLLAERPAGLLDALMHVPLQPAPQPPPTTLSLLTDRRLAALVAGYLQRHGLAYGVRFLTWRRGDRAAEAALFDIVTAAEVRPVPGFVCDFLRRLPLTTLLADALDPADLESEPARRILLPQGRRTPLHLPHVQELLPAHSLLIIAGEPWGAALISPPAPRTTMQRITEASIDAPATAALSAQPAGRLQLQLQLRRNGPARGPIHGLLLDAAALIRLRRMVGRLPAPLFARARIALGDNLGLVLADDDGELSGLPIGLPLARAEPPALLLPRGMQLTPALPQDLLIPALAMRPETLTVLTPTSRYDVPLDALQPIAGLLTLETQPQDGAIIIRPTAMPALDLSDLEELSAAPPLPAQPSVETPPALPEKERRSLLERLLKSDPGERAAGKEFLAELRRRAAELERDGELEQAAAFYSYLGDTQRAGACYRRLQERG